MIRPLLKDIHCVERPGCKYPIAVKLTMEDGQVKRFNLDCAESPHLFKTKQSFEESLSISIGYQYKPPRKRRIRSHRCDR